jgi:glutamate-ammonia-ligase adenylyltransferase
MTLADRLTRCPRPHDPEDGAEALRHAPGLSGPLADLVAGAAGCSPFLKSLVEREGAWLEGAVEAPEDALAALHDGLRETAPDRLGTALRRAKRRVALLTALADLGGAWPLEEVTGHLTDFADLACDLALRAALGTEIRRGKLPGMGEKDIATGAGMVVFAMGKMGARELNYSSDIDLICLFDETRFERDDFHEARASLVRATRRMSALLNDRTAEGYVFRTDLRLRPDPGVTPVCMAMAAAETYYESLGRTWERAAWIKARPCAGDLEAGERFIATLRPFVWRKHLDFAAIEDAHNMRLAIRAHKGLGGAFCLEGHNIKLGRGGIREIEFFTQTRQLIAGGRDPDLRVRGTVEGLARLAEKGWVPPEAAETLTDNYRCHREVEHRVQMLRDAQTHLLPNSAAEFDRLAAFMGRETADLRAEITRRVETVDDLIEGFFRQEAPGGARAPEAPEAEFDEEVIARWHGYPALRSERAQQIFARLRPEILGLRRVPAGAACRGAGVCVVRGEPAADRPAGGHCRHRAVAGRLPVAQRGRVRRRHRGRFLCAMAGARGAGGRSRRAAGGAGGLRARAGRGAPLAQGMAFPRRRASSARAGRCRGRGRALCRSGRGGDRCPLAARRGAIRHPARRAAGARGRGDRHGFAGGGAAQRALRSRPDRDL